MRSVNYRAVLGGGLAAFVFAAVYYTALAPIRMTVSSSAFVETPPVWLMGVELAKQLFVAWFVTVLVTALNISRVNAAIGLGLGLWMAFPVVLLIGSVTQEGTPLLLAVIHGGDWLAKLLIVSIVAAVWGVSKTKTPSTIPQEAANG